MHHVVGGKGNNVLLNNHFDAVGQRLEQAEGADAIGAEAVLHAAEDFAFADGGDGEAGAENGHEAGNGEGHGNERLHGGRRQAFQPMGRRNKDLVQGVHVAEGVVGAMEAAAAEVAGVAGVARVAGVVWVVAAAFLAWALRCSSARASSTAAASVG